MLMESATRFVAGRNAVQTIYWRTKSINKQNNNHNDGIMKMIKYNRTCTFDKVSSDTANSPSISSSFFPPKNFKGASH